MNLSLLNLLGKACGMNKKKNGSLKYLSIIKCVKTYANLY